VINVDNEVPTQPCFHIYWNRHPVFHRLHRARWGWQ
jgi:hypothetical protein